MADAQLLLLLLLGAWLGVARGGSIEEQAESLATTAISARDPSLLLRRYLQDPLQVEPFNATAPASLRSRFWDVLVRGLSDAQLRHVEANLTAATLEAQVTLPLLRVEGQYKLQGRMAFLPIEGEGPFTINATSVTAAATAQLERNAANGRPSVRSLRVHTKVEDLQVHLHNLLGGGRWASFGNALINQVAGSAFRQVQRSLASELESGLREHLNRELATLPPLEAFDGGLLVDALVRRAGDELRTNNADPLPLPDMQRKLEWDFALGRLVGDVALTQCTLNGLSTIKRIGDILALYRNSRYVVEAELGFDNISGNCNWRAQLLGAGPEGTTSLHVRALQLQLRLALGPEGPPQLESLQLQHVGPIWAHLQGLGTWDFLLQTLANLVANAFRWSLAEAALAAVADELRAQLKNVVLPYE